MSRILPRTDTRTLDALSHPAIEEAGRREKAQVPRVSETRNTCGTTLPRAQVAPPAALMPEVDGAVHRVPEPDEPIGRRPGPHIR